MVLSSTQKSRVDGHDGVDNDHADDDDHADEDIVAEHTRRRMARRYSGSRPDAPDEADVELAIVGGLEPSTREQHSTREQQSAQSDHHRQPGQPSDADAEKANSTKAHGTIANAGKDTPSAARLATRFYTLSYLVFFAVFGTLARLGLQALTDYPGTPVTFSSVWPNFAGSLVMGFLVADRKLFRDEWGERPTFANLGEIEEAKRHLAAKATIPLYVGLATGFCGSFTSFSAFIRDIFLALANHAAAVDDTNAPRNGGYSFLALVAVVIVTLSLSLGGFFVGAHLADALAPWTPSIAYPSVRDLVDRIVAVLGWGCWIGAIVMSAVPPDPTWRGQALFALVFAPLGCLVRYYASLLLNGRIASFPLGTFAVNIAGTLVLGMAWDLAHVPLGGVVGCQVLQGVEDGFCGCLTTVSTWVSELARLRRRHAYIYGTASVLVGLVAMVAVMGGLEWSDGFAPLQCTH